MRIGVPKEIKNNEYRVAITPAGVMEFVRRGHKVYVETMAGMGSGFLDAAFESAGAIVTDVKTLYDKAEMIYKVKEILAPEYQYMREDLIVFTYLHSNSNRELTDVMLDKKVIGIAYEDIKDAKGQYPLLKPMSELAGKGGFIAALNFCQSVNGGNGTLLARVHGVKTPKVTIIGAGAAGVGAAELAAGFGNKVAVLDIDLDKLEALKFKLSSNVELLYSNRVNLENCLKDSDVIINCLLWPKTRKDHLINREDLKLMKPGSLIIDVSCDEAGAIETSRPTSHDDPIYKVDGIVHYAVDNIPSAFSETATEALSNVTLPFALKIAGEGAKMAMINSPELRSGLTFYDGKLTLEETAIKQEMTYTSPEEALGITQ